MTKPIVIGFGHVARTGKDAAADRLVAEYGFERQGFTDALNELLLAVNPEVAEIIHTCDGDWDLAKDAYPPVRLAQQTLGQAVRTHLDPEAWVKAIVRRWLPGGRYVVKNVRYPNEAQAVLDAGGSVFRIDRPGVGPVNEHVSERALAEWKGWSGVIHNDGSLDDLYAKVDLMMEELGLVPVAR